MMEECGIPTFYLQSLVYGFAEKLKVKGMMVPDLAMGAPYVKVEPPFFLFNVCAGLAMNWKFIDIVWNMY